MPELHEKMNGSMARGMIIAFYKRISGRIELSASEAQEKDRGDHMEHEKRQYRRFPMDAGTLIGRLDHDHTVDIMDMSVGGAAVKADRRLTVGSEYAMKLETPDGGIAVKGVVVRSRMLGIWENFQGERVPIYASAVKFREGSEEQIADFLCGAILA
jgi:hypothetical protein